MEDMMNEVLQRLLDERKPTRRAVHGTGNIYTTADEYQSQFAEWQECGFSWVKLLGSGDSQVETCRRLKASGSKIIPILRLYYTDCPNNHVAPDMLKPYVDNGCVIIESSFNEFYYPHENVWGANLRAASAASTVGGTVRGEIVRADLSKMTWPPKKLLSIASMPPDWPAQVAHGWAMFAASVLTAGGVPTTPAIEGWQYDNIFKPLFAVLVDQYAELLRQSVVAMHNRPLNHPIAYATDTGAWLAWTKMDAWIQDALGHPLPMIATEAGPEPGWDMDKTFPKITPDMHAQMVRDTLAWPTPDNYLADCFWLWEGAGAWDGARWKRNTQHMGGADLPAVKMLKEWQPEPEEPEPVDTVDDVARDQATIDMADYPWGDKWAFNHGMIPFGDQLPFKADGTWWFCRPAFRLSDSTTGLIVFPDGGYTDAQTTFIPWSP
jgi:hypothetical protein